MPDPREYTAQNIKDLVDEIRQEFDHDTKGLPRLLKNLEQEVGKLTDANARETTRREVIRISLENLQKRMDQINEMIRDTLDIVEQELSPVRARAMDRSIPPGAGAQEDQFSNFLATIGNSIVKSQEALDARSIKYLESIQGLPFIPPTLFRIPKLSASLKVGLAKKSSEELNIFIASSKKEMEETNEQSINLEISAVPASPEMLQSLKDGTPRVEFLFNRFERQRIFDIVRQQAADLKLAGELSEGVKAKLEEQLKRMLEHQEQVLIWPIKDKNAHILLFAGKKSDSDVGIWFLNQEQGATSLEPIIRLDLKANSRTKENHGPLRAFVFELGKAQAELL